MSWFSNIFAEDVEEDQGGQSSEVSKASEILAAADMPYFRRLLDYIENEADRPVKIGGSDILLESAVRSNTFKEIRQKIRRDIKDAQGLIGSLKHGI